MQPNDMQAPGIRWVDLLVTSIAYTLLVWALFCVEQWATTRWGNIQLYNLPSASVRSVWATIHHPVSFTGWISSSVHQVVVFWRIGN